MTHTDTRRIKRHLQHLSDSMLFCLVSSILAQKQNSGVTIAVENERSFCLMIPPRPGELFGPTEHEAIAACYGNPRGALGAISLPSGFIQSAHFLSTDSYVQVTGRMDGATYGMDPNDDGGMIDDASWGIRPTSTCFGYSSYVEYMGARPGVYCVRCCKSGHDHLCDATRDRIGCFQGIPGDYGPGFTSTQTGSNPGVVGSPPSPTNQSRVPQPTVQPGPPSTTQDSPSSQRTSSISIMITSSILHQAPIPTVAKPVSNTPNPTPTTPNSATQAITSWWLFLILLI
jgi:hypothetical protein